MTGLPIGQLLQARRAAVAQGEVARMWPGAVWDVATLVWFRGIWHPLLDRIAPRPVDPYHSPGGECPLCNPTNGGAS